MIWWNLYYLFLPLLFIHDWHTVPCKFKVYNIMIWPTYIMKWLPQWSCLAEHLSSQFSSVAQSCGLFATPWTAARQASLSVTNSWSLPKLMSIELVMPSNHLTLCHPFLLPPSIFHSITVFSSESLLRIRCPKYWSFSFSISPSNVYSGLISFRMDWLDLLARFKKEKKNFCDKNF